MKRILLVFLLFCIISSIKAQPLVENIEPSTQYNAFFKEAYQKYPNIPKGILEAVAYTQTHIRHIDPNKEQQSCTGMPLPYGVMGLFDDGKGVFRENLKTIASLGHYDVQMIKSDARTNILAYAAAYSALLSARRITVSTPQEQLNILAELSELPLEKNGIDNFALDAQLYTILRFIQDKNNQSRFGFPDYKMDLRKTFGANYEVLSAKSVTLSEESIIAEDYFYHPEVSITSKVLSIDYAPALWNPTTCNYSSRNGTAITAYAVHTVQGTYSGCISWFKNCSAQASSHYVVRSSDGQVTQMVLESDKAWHVGSENPYTIGTEHEGFVDDASWYTLAMYASSADIVRDVINSGYGINGLRTYFGPGTTGLNTLGSCVKIKGHQHFPNQTHVDPGVNWNWEYFYTLVNNNPTITNYTTATGSVTDPGGANGNYANDIRQSILIAPNGANSVTLNVSIFDIETNWDYLLIFNGNNNQAPLLGKYTGKNIPTSILANSGKVYMEFRTDCATVDTGFVISWTSIIPDNTPPTTTISGTSGWKTSDFNATFADNDNIGITESFYQVNDFDGNNWSGNPNSGFLNESFTGTSISSNWTNMQGMWGIVSNALVQTDEVNSNTNIYASLTQNADQAYLYHFKMNIEGTGTNRRAGFHFFSDNGSMSNRNNSYFVFFRADNSKLQIYETNNDVFTLMADLPLTISAGIEHDVKIIYQPTTGKIDVYFNNLFAGTWTDPTPLTNGNAVSFRTGNAKTTFDNLNIYKSRNSNALITVSPNGNIRYANFNTGTPSGKISSIVKDAAHNWSTITENSVNIDFSPPTSIATINDGLVADINTTTNGTELSANWTASTDPNSDISYYEYAIGTTIGNTDILPFTQTGLTTSVTKTGLSLINGQTYYFTVRTFNNAGLVSTSSSSNGQTYNQIITCGTDAYEANNTKATAKACGLNTTRQALICPATDTDWFKFTSNATKKNLKIELTNLPADYKLELYKGNSILLFTSNNSGTTSETIIYNNAPAIQYFIKVSGVNGATNPNLPYNLRVSNSSSAWRTADPENSTMEIAHVTRIDEPIAQITNPISAGENAQITIEGFSGISTIRMYDMQGKEVNSIMYKDITTNTPFDYEVPISLQKGLYLIMLQLGEKITTLKLMVQ